MSARNKLNPYKTKNLALSIGIFDGVHRGHQKILRKLVKEARALGTKSLVITFYPHPREVLNPGSKIPLLISLKHRLALIKSFGVDSVLVARFTKKFSRMPPGDFIKKILVKRLRVKSIVMGERFLFGRRKKGDFSLLKKTAEVYGFHLMGVKSVKVKGEPISSTKIRSLIEKGELREASIMLGRPVTVLGTVVKGRRVGRNLGFPTANIDPHHEIIPPKGVYAVSLSMYGRPYRGVLNIGTRPTFASRCTILSRAMRHKNTQPILELHILNFKKDIYGKDIEIIFNRKIREEKKFDSRDLLRAQIRKDVLSIK